MTGLRLDLADAGSYPTPQAYVEQHLAPLATELHRITNELLAPGATSAEEWSVDMVPSLRPTARFTRLDKPLVLMPKHVVFDGSVYHTLPAEHRRAKQVKVQLTAVVYGYTLAPEPSEVAFRLVGEDGRVVDNSTFSVTTDKPVTVSRILPFGTQDGSIADVRCNYLIEGRSLGLDTQPVCRRLSLSFVYI